MLPLLLVLVAAAGFCQANTDAFYSTISDMLAGHNYYDMLQMTRSRSTSLDPSKVRKAWIRKSRHVHPDKNNSPEAAEEFMLLGRARDVLSDQEKLQEYHDFLDNGIPWYERTYGLYAHRVGAPTHDIRVALPVFCVVVTVLHYLWRIWYHRYYHRLARRTARYRESFTKHCKQNGVELSKAEKDQLKAGKLDGSQFGFELNVHGAEYPVWSKDLLPIKVITFPKYCFERWTQTEEQKEREYASKMGMEWEEYLEKKAAALKKNATRLKKIERIMKKRR